MELQGTVKKLSEILTFASGFQKRELVLSTEEQYPQPINIEFLQEKAELLNNIKEGDKVKIGINIRGREWTSPQGEVKYFNSIVGWRIQKTDGSADYNEPINVAATSSNSVENIAAKDDDPFGTDENDDLPF